MSVDWNTWVITPDARRKYDTQFQLLRPTNGFLMGDQLKQYFLTFGLPVAVLGRIWSLADTDVDGRLDKREFAIAMFLIEKSLARHALPPSLPPGLMVNPRSGLVSPLPPLSPLQPLSPIPSLTYTGHSNGEVTTLTGVKQDQSNAKQSEFQTWTISAEIRPKYRLLFNQHDRLKRGFITGVEARAIFIKSGLSQQILAHIWTLADLDKDGNLNGEEFCIATFLIDKALAGHALPDTLPASLLPSAPRPPVDQATTAVKSEGTVEEDAATSSLSFEDKRRENFLQGQIELDKRKQELAEKMRMEEEARLEKERQERERQQRLRKEEEERKALEAQRQAEHLKSLEAQKDLRRQQAFEDRTRAWRAAEAQRLADTERQRVESLKRERLHVQTLLEQAIAHRASLSESASVQEQRRRELSQRLLLTTTDLNAHKDAITDMRSKRDAYERDIRDLTEQVEAAKAELTRWQRQREELNLRRSATSPTSEWYKSLTANQALHHDDIRRLTLQLAELENRLTEQGQELAHKRTKADEIEQRSSGLQVEVDELRQTLQNKLRLGTVTLKPSGDVLASSHATDPTHNHDVYDVMYHFTARHPDELSLVAGSSVLVHRSPPVTLAPGWLYGESDGRKGVFPESYARKLESGKIDPFDPFGVHRVIAHSDNAFDSDFPRSQPTIIDSDKASPTPAPLTKPPSNFSGPPLFTCVAMYPFDSNVAGDLHLAVGDVIKVYNIRDEWYEGVCEQKNASGLFPANYARKLPPEEDHTVRNYDLNLSAINEIGQIKWPEPSATETPPVQTGVEQPPAFDVFSPTSVDSSKDASGTKPELARVIAPYTATSAGQLSLQPGQVVQVRKRSPKGWWEGEIQQRGRGRQYGWFPADYVKVITPPDTNGTTPGIMVNSGDAQVGETVKAASVSPSTTSPNVERMRALFAYEAANDDELTFEEGAIITVLSRDEPQWWLGRLKSTGAEGLFPVNYVRPHHPSGTSGKESGRSAVSPNSTSVK